MLGIAAAERARATSSFRAWCRIDLPAAFLQTNAWRPNTSTWAPQPIIIIIIIVIIIVVVVVVVVADEYCEDHSVHSLVSRLQSQRRFKVTVSL